MERDDRNGFEVVYPNASTSSIAATQLLGKNHDSKVAGGAARSEAKVEEGGDDHIRAGENKDEPPAPCKEKDHAGPPAEGVPVTHVESGQDSHRADDVSSLQHSVALDKQRNVQGKGVIGEEGGGIHYYYVDEEQERTLRRRNVLIILVLLMFLCLVVAIGVGVGLAVKNRIPDAGPDRADCGSQFQDGSGGGEEGGGVTDDDEFNGIGGGVVEDDDLRSEAPSSHPSNSGPCIPAEVGIIFDEYSDETGWLLVRGNYHPENPELNDVVWESKYYQLLEYAARADTFHRCFPPGDYTFVFTDREGDGICCYHGEGLYVLSSEGKVIKIGGEMNSNEETAVFKLPFVEPEPMDGNSDGRDDRLGWIMPYDSSNLTEGVTCENFRLVILTDQYGVETTWELYEGKDKSGELVADGGPYASEYTYVVDYCLASPREYSLYMYDWDRRGLCCNTGEGMYRVTSGNIVIHDSNGHFGELNVTRFLLPADGLEVLPADPSQSPTVIVPVSRKTQFPTKFPTTPAQSNSLAAPALPTISNSPMALATASIPLADLQTSPPTGFPNKLSAEPDRAEEVAMDKDITTSPFPAPMDGG